MNIRNEIRKSIINMMHISGSSHIGSCLSIVDILYTLYYKIMIIDPTHPDKTDRDIFILSKANASAALYATLAVRGFFPKDYLKRFYIDNGILPGHLDMEIVRGIETSGGSLGHGLSIGVGMAIARRTDNNPSRIFVLIGDGECNEGSVWEAVMLAATMKLNNLTAIIDLNKLQGFGYTDDIIDMRNMAEKWKVFGWEVYEIDGHNIKELEKTLKIKQDKPKAIIARTVKGKGVPFMENKLEWHYKSPNDEQLSQALNDIDS